MRSATDDNLREDRIVSKRARKNQHTGRVKLQGVIKNGKWKHQHKAKLQVTSRRKAAKEVASGCILFIIHAETVCSLAARHWQIIPGNAIRGFP